MMGRVVMSLRRKCVSAENKITFHFDQFNKGIYNIFIYNSKTRFAKKIIIE